MLINFYFFYFCDAQEYIYSRETGTPIMNSRAAHNQIVYTKKQHEIPLCIFHKQPIIKNNRVTEHHKISMKTPCKLNSNLELCAVRERI